jgi:hypothetical protein
MSGFSLLFDLLEYPMGNIVEVPLQCWIFKIKCIGRIEGFCANQCRVVLELGQLVEVPPSLVDSFLSRFS